MIKYSACLSAAALAAVCLCSVVQAAAQADETTFTVLYRFQPGDANTLTSPLGSQPDTTPVVGADGAIYGMTSLGGRYGNGVIYRYESNSHQYAVLHTFSAVDANGDNADGAAPGVSLTRGPGNLIYGMAQFGGANGTGTVFEVTPSGQFRVLHTFSALDANGHNPDGVFPLRAMIIGNDGKLYGTTRSGGLNTCLFTHGCGVAWVMDRLGFRVIHQFTADEGHAASQIQGRDGFLYGCAVWPATALPPGPLPSGVLYRMSPSGEDFEVLHRFTQTDANGENVEGADCYEPLVETSSGVFYGTAFHGGTNGNGTVFRYSNSHPGAVDVVHEFSATNAAAQNWDGAGPFGRLALAANGVMYSNTESGGANGNGVLFSIRQDGHFAVVHTFSPTNATTGANWDGALPDEGLIVDGNRILGTAEYGGIGSPAGYNNSGGTLYEIKLGD